MALDFDLFRVVDVKNPSKHCTEVYFSNSKQGELKKTSLVVFEQQIKYVMTEEYEDHKRVKIFIRDDQYPILIEFHPDEYHLFESFFLSLYNKNI